MNAQQTITAIENGKFNEIFTTLYGEENIPAQKVRYTNTVNEFAKLFGADREISLFSVAGRSEISGNRRLPDRRGRHHRSDRRREPLLHLEVYNLRYVQRLPQVRPQGRRL